MRDALGRLINSSAAPAAEPGYSPEPAAVAAPRPRRIRASFVEYGLLALLILSPLPAASVEDWSILAIELLAALLAAATLFRRPAGLNAKLEAKLRLPGFLAAGLFAFLGLQIAPLPKAVVRLLSPNFYGLRERFDPGFAHSGSLSLSIVPAQTARAALELLAYVLIGWVVLRTVTHRRQIVRFLSVIVALGAAQAFYGLFELYRNNPRVLFFPKVYNLNSATGTFINRNHFSGYLELILPLALTLIIARIDIFSLAGKKWSEKLGQITGRGFALNILALIGVVIMALAIVLSRSRSGVFVLCFSFLLFFLLTAYHFNRNRYRQAWIKTFLKVVFVLILAVSLYVGVEATVGRFSEDNLLQEGRPQYWSSVLRMVGDGPLMGTGWGTFGAVYPSYETVAMEGRLLHAHNDYLEALAELGVVGFVLLLGLVLWPVLDAFRTWSTRRHPGIKGLGMGGFVALAAMLVHSLTDFNLHIPANAVLFAVVLGLTVATAYYRKA
ncbi:MAG: O-antigen ligase family protein [Candidatus Aminicenantes bacterium]|nr:O-antigen ligase family protein [Candidatus Aminicenantes bacterium]